eukprot:s21_g24.t1
MLEPASVKVAHPRSSPPEEQPTMLRHASSVGGGTAKRLLALREPIICEWCGELEPPTHPKQCKLRLVECKHCKQTMQLGSLRLHFKGCAARPIVPPKNVKGGSGFLTLHRLQSNAQHLSRQLHDILGRFVGKLPPPPEQVSLFMMDLDSKLEVFGEEINTLRMGFECLERRDRQIVKQRLQEAQMHLKVGERSRMRCGVSRLQSSGQQIHRQLDEITQEAVRFEIGDPRMNKRYAPATLEEQLEAMKEEATALERLQETRVAQGLAPELKALTELQGRLNFFMELLISVTEAVSKNDQVANLVSLARRRPPGAAGVGAVEEERRPLGILTEAQIELAESSPLPPDRGPAGMGLREVPLDQLRAEIAQERQRYIAFHLLRQHTEHPRTRWTTDKTSRRQLTGHLAEGSRSSSVPGCPAQSSKRHDEQTDVPTSGLILVAKTHEAYYDLQLQVAAGQVVLCHGRLTGVRHITARLHWGHFGQDVPSVVRSYGKPSRTRVKAMQSNLAAMSRSFSLLAVVIDTGRRLRDNFTPSIHKRGNGIPRHQIRVHMAHIGHAVVSDGKYTCPATAAEDLRETCPSTFLHRYRLSFHGRKDPSAPDEVHEALQELPEALQEALTRQSRFGARIVEVSLEALRLLDPECQASLAGTGTCYSCRVGRVIRSHHWDAQGTKCQLETPLVAARSHESVECSANVPFRSLTSSRNMSGSAAIFDAQERPVTQDEEVSEQSSSFDPFCGATIARLSKKGFPAFESSKRDLFSEGCPTLAIWEESLTVACALLARWAREESGGKVPQVSRTASECLTFTRGLLQIFQAEDALRAGPGDGFGTRSWQMDVKFWGLEPCRIPPQPFGLAAAEPDCAMLIALGTPGVRCPQSVQDPHPQATQARHRGRKAQQFAAATLGAGAAVHAASLRGGKRLVCRRAVNIPPPVSDSDAGLFSSTSKSEETAEQPVEALPDRSSRPKVLVLGSGWASASFLQGLTKEQAQLYDITIISKRNFFLYTPLLPTCTMGSIEERSIVTPIRELAVGKADFLEARCEGIDVEQKVVRCSRARRSKVSSNAQYHRFPDKEADDKYVFEMPYDILIYAIGAETNDFNVPGVKQHTFYFKELIDARHVRSRISDLFEEAALPGVSDEDKDALLNFIVIGGGPTGVEIAADLADFVAEDCKRLYPKLHDQVTISLVNMEDHLLSTYSRDISDRSLEVFKSKGVNVLNSWRVTEVTSDVVKMVNKKGDCREIPHGCVIWAAGVKPSKLTQQLKADLQELNKGKREAELQGKARGLCTDEWLNVWGSKGSIFALGDASTVQQECACFFAEDLFKDLLNRMP